MTGEGPGAVPQTDRPWLAERVVDLPRAARLIAAAAPELAGRPVRAFAEGWDNAVFAVDADRTWLFRFCRRAIAVRGIRREIEVLPIIAGRLPLPIPLPTFVGDDGHPQEPWPFFGTPAVPGVELAEARTSATDRVSVARELGAFLRTLHGLPVPYGVDLPTDPMSRGWPAARHDDTTAVLRRLDERVDWSGTESAIALLDEAAAAGPPTRAPVLVHGDLHLRHVLVTIDGHCAGVIDWGDLCLGDRSIDLAIGFAAFAGASRAAFVAAYTEGTGWDDDVALRARALAVRMTTFLALHAADVDDQPMLTEALAGLDRTTT